MLLFTITFGGLLLMMGHHSRAESLFYYFRLEDQVAENHLLRLIDRHVNLEFIRQQLKDSYSGTGRPSIDPELLLRILLLGYLYGISSERRLVEELRMHLAWRWFTGLGFDQEVPHHSTFSKNRHGRFKESKLFQPLFEQIVKQCVEVGLVQGKHLSVEGSFVEANASKESRIPREQLAEGDGSPDESGDGGRARHAHALHRVASTNPRIGGRRHDLRERRVLAMASRSEHHSLHADPRQYPPKEEPILWPRAFHVRTGKQSLYLPRRSAAQLWGESLSESRLQLHRDTQKVWPVL